MLGVYVILAMLGNILPTALLPESSLMFGSIAVLLVVFFYGIGWGVAAALLAVLHTIALGLHPFIIIIFIGEALVVGFLLKREINLALADVCFWIFIGLPFYGLFYHVFMQMSLAATGVIVTKQAANGIFNAIMAVTLLRFLKLHQYHKPTTLWDNWLSIILLSFALPSLLIMMFNGKSFTNILKPSYELQVLANCQVLDEKLTDSLHKVKGVGEELALLATQRDLQNLSPLQSRVESLQEDLPPGTQIYISDTNNRIILSSFEQSLDKNDINPEQDRCTLRGQQYRAGYSEVHTDDIMPVPHLSFNIPIIKRGHLTGSVHIILSNKVHHAILQDPDRKYDVTFSVIDQWGKIFASSDNKKQPMEDFFINDKHENGLLSNSPYVWHSNDNRLIATNTPLPLMKSSDSGYLLGGETPLQLAVEFPAAITLASLHSRYLNSLLLMLTPALLALFLGWMLNKRVTDPLNELVGVTSNLADKYSNGEEIYWPEKSGREVLELTANFRELLTALENKEKLLQQWSEENTQIRNEAGKVLDNAHAQRNWEVFSAGRKLRAEMDHGQRMKELLVELEAAEEKYRFLVEKSLVGVYIIRADKLIYVNPRFAEILGYPHEELLQGVKLKTLVAKDDWLLVRANQQKQLRNEAADLQYQYQALCKDNTIKHVEVLDGIANYGGNPAIIGTLLDITDRVKAEETIKHMAYHDPLTGLPNRLLFQDRINQSFIFAERHQKMVGLLFLDLDRFKAVNDTLGHVAGDQLLKEVSERLQKGLRSSDTISRFGGDEFNILVTEVNLESDIQMVAHKIIRAMEYPFYIGEQELFVTCSIGIAIYPRDCHDAESLTQKADTALYCAKDMGRNNFQTYNDGMGSQALERMALESSLRHSLERHELRIYYQPQISLLSGKIVGVEALVRWKHSDGEIIPPSRFIPLAEEIGFIAPIGEWVLRTACLQAKAWQNEGFPPIRMGVNVSASQFDTAGFGELVSEIINETAISPEWVNLEITESVVVKNAEEAIVKFHELHNVGLTIAIDDFGIGYSSLSYLKDFPVDQLKMDRAFVRNLPHEKDDANIAIHIVEMAHDLKISVIAEGVENKEQFDFLRSLGCDEVQGYMVSKPVPAEEIIRFFEETYS